VYYTFHATAVSLTLPETLSSRPADCPVTHDLEVQDPTVFTDLGASTFTPLISFSSATRLLSVHYSVDNRFSILIINNVIPLRIVAKMNNQMTVISLQPFNLIMTKDCSFATLTSSALSTAAMTYTISEPALFVSYTLPTRSDIHCALEYSIEVTDSTTSTTLLYNDVGRFQADPSTAALHSDGVTRTESYLIQNQTNPAAGTHSLKIWSSTTTMGNLDIFLGSVYTVVVNTKIAPFEVLSGALP